MSFHKCECGIELKILYVLEDDRQFYTCDCGRTIALPGTVLDMYFVRGGAFSREKDWIKVPNWKIRDQE